MCYRKTFLLHCVLQNLPSCCTSIVQYIPTLYFLCSLSITNYVYPIIYDMITWVSFSVRYDPEGLQVMGVHVACFCFIALFLVIFRKVLLVLCNTRVQSHSGLVLLISTFTAKVSCKLIWGSLACYISVYVTFFCQVFHHELCVYCSCKNVVQLCFSFFFSIFFYPSPKQTAVTDI